MNLVFSGRGLAFLARFQAIADIRYYLNGVHFEPLPEEAGGGVLGAATDGHVMGIWHDAQGQCDRPVIAKITKPLAAACDKPRTWLENVGGRLTAVNYDEARRGGERVPGLGFERFVQPNEKPAAMAKTPGRVQGWEVEGKFPEAASVIGNRSDYTMGLQGAFNARLLAQVSEAFIRASESRKYLPDLRFRQCREEGAALALSARIPEAAAVIMPMHESQTFAECAPWMRRWKDRDNRSKAALAAPPPAMPSDAAPPPDFRPQYIIPAPAARRRTA